MGAPTVKFVGSCSKFDFRILLLCICTISPAGILEYAHAATHAWKTDIETIRSKAAKGDAYYQGLLGIRLKYGGDNEPIDLVESERWSIKAAESNGAFGLCNLASLEMRKRNFEKGRFLYDEAHLHSNLLRLARAGDPVAIFCLGLIEMECPPRNVPKAIRHFLESSRKGFAPAQATIGMLKLNGIGTTRDLDEGIKWLQAAARSESPYGKFHLGMAYSIGTGVSFDQTKSMKLIREAAEQGLGSAQLTLGMKYANAEGLTQDYALAVEWLRKASKQGLGEATFQLRRCETMLNKTQSSSTPPDEPVVPSDTSVTSTADPEKTIEKLPPIDPVDHQPKTITVPVPSTPPMDKGTVLRLQQARHLLLVERKTPQAKKALEGLAKNGVTEAQRLLGIANYRSQDYADANVWFLQAAKKNDPQAQRYLGMSYFLGQGVKRDYLQASVWLGKAAAQGDEEAIRYREILRKFYQE